MFSRVFKIVPGWQILFSYQNRESHKTKKHQDSCCFIVLCVVHRRHYTKADPPKIVLLVPGWLITSQNLDAGNFPPRKRFVQSPSLWYITPSFPKWQNCIFPMKSQSENIVLKFCVVTSPVKEKMRWSRIMTLSSAWDNAPDPMFIMDRLLSVAQVSLGVCRNELILSEQEVGKLGAEKSKPRQRGYLGKFSSI